MFCPPCGFDNDPDLTVPEVWEATWVVENLNPSGRASCFGSWATRFHSKVVSNGPLRNEELGWVRWRGTVMPQCSPVGSMGVERTPEHCRFLFLARSSTVDNIEPLIRVNTPGCGGLSYSSQTHLDFLPGPIQAVGAKQLEGETL